MESRSFGRTFWIALGVPAALLGAVWWATARDTAAPPTTSARWASSLPSDSHRFDRAAPSDDAAPADDAEQPAAPQHEARKEALKLDNDLRQWFESQVADKSPETLRAEADRAIDQRFESASVTEAKRLLGRYLEYRKALPMAEQNVQAPPGGPLETTRARMRAERQLQALYFSEREVRDLFGASNAHDDAALARFELSINAALSTEQRQAQRTAIDQALARTLAQLAPRGS